MVRKRSNRMKDKENSKKNKTFTLDFFVYLFIFIVLIGIICYFPMLFTKPGNFDFRETGQIGDTIGGIMGPFVAIAAAILTFLAFWVQFKANEQQRKDIALERFESKFYKLLDIHMQNTNNLNICELKGRAVFKYLVDDFYCIYDEVEDIYRDLSTESYSLTNDERGMLTKLSYGFFFYGSKYLHHSQNKIENDLYKKISEKFENKNYPYQIGNGYNMYLGHYYRNLFQLVKFVANYNNCPITERQRYEYIKIIRAQLSDYEQIMLYYNSISVVGRNWNNIKDKNSDIPQQRMGYIARFKLIKNIPFDSLVGLWPNLKYEEEMAVYQSLGERFFEHDVMKCLL